jgi:hypothetical protein
MGKTCQTKTKGGIHLTWLYMLLPPLIAHTRQLRCLENKTAWSKPVNHGIHIVTLLTGSQSYGGTASDTQFGGLDSPSSGDSPDPFLDRPSRSRTGGSNNDAASGDGDDDSVRAGGSPAQCRPCAYKLGRFGSAPPPPPPPPPGAILMWKTTTWPSF